MNARKLCAVLVFLVVGAMWPVGAQAEEAEDDGELDVAGHAMFRYTQKFGADDSAEIYNLRLYLRWEFEDETVVDRIEWIVHAYF